MKILIVTPLYPPDIAEPAPYVKELARRLSLAHAVTILAYNHIPETLPNVRIIAVEKRLPTILRLIAFTIRFLLLSQQADRIYIQNGPSTELPFTIVSYLMRRLYILRIGDMNALKYTHDNTWYTRLLQHATRRATYVVTHPDCVHMLTDFSITPTPHVLSRPHARPEILPFSSYPNDSFSAYESSWTSHVEDLQKI